MTTMRFPVFDAAAGGLRWIGRRALAFNGAGTAGAKVHGTCQGRFEAVRSALARNLESGEELGASLVVDIDGEIVVDMWGGFCDQARAVPW